MLENCESLHSMRTQILWVLCDPTSQYTIFNEYTIDEVVFYITFNVTILSSYLGADLWKFQGDEN